MKFVVCLSVLVGVLSLGLAYPAKASPSSSDSLDRKKAELRALEQELKGLMQRAESDVKGVGTYESDVKGVTSYETEGEQGEIGVKGVKGVKGYVKSYEYSAVKGVKKAEVSDVKGEVKGEVKGQSVSDPDVTAFDPVREPPNVIFNRHYVAFQSVGSTIHRLECHPGGCYYFDCGQYHFSYPEWRECYNAVFKVYRRDGEGVLRVGDYIGFIQFSTNEWIQCPGDSCLLGDCPGVPNDYDGFEDPSKWCECDDYAFRLAAYNKTIGQPIYPNDVVMIFQPKSRTYIDINGDKTTCPGTTFPPALEAYEECVQGSYFLNY